MKITDWVENTRVAIVGAVGDSSSINGSTTRRPPFRDGDVTKVEILDDAGNYRNIAVSRTRIKGQI